MILSRLVMSLVALSLGLSICCATANALTDREKARVRTQYQIYIKQKPKYVMRDSIKPDAPISEGVDCSRYKYLVYRDAGVGNMRRVTSKDISDGKGGWTGIDVPWDEIEEYDFLFYTWKDPKHPNAPPKRIRGHIVTMWDVIDGWETITHASQGRGRIVVDRLRGKFVSDFDKARRIIVGK